MSQLLRRSRTGEIVVGTRRPTVNPASRERRQGQRKAPSYGSRRGEKLVDGMSKAELVAHYTPKVKLVAHKMAENLPSSMTIDDLISVGYIGLMDAADKFDPTRGFKFGTYAEFRIRGAILDELRNQDWIPRSVRDQAKAIDRAYHKLEHANGRRPTEEELGHELGITREEFQRMKDEVGLMALTAYDDVTEVIDCHLHEKHGNEDERTNPFIRLNRSDARGWLDQMFSTLTAEEKLVLSCYYYRGLNLREIGDIMNLGESRISQLHSRAIRKIQAMAREKEGESVRGLFLTLLEAS